MIRPLRKAHARIWLFVLPIALAALALALLTRAPRPIQGPGAPGASAPAGRTP
jgi:hypothetical protein